MGNEMHLFAGPLGIVNQILFEIFSAVHDAPSWIQLRRCWHIVPIRLERPTNISEVRCDVDPTKSQVIEAKNTMNKYDW